MKTLAPSQTVPSVITTRDPKGRKFLSIIEMVYNNENLSDAEAQRINDTPGLSHLIASFIDENRSTGKFDRASVRYYLSGYTNPKEVGEQADMLHRLFQNLTPVKRKFIEGPKHPLSEGRFVIPRWQSVATTYSIAVEKVLVLLKEAYGGTLWADLHPYEFGSLSEKCIRQSEQSVKAWEQIECQQEQSDLLVIPAQFGFRHHDRSADEANRVMKADEFSLGAFAVGCMLLTHPKRLQVYHDPAIVGAGDYLTNDPYNFTGRNAPRFRCGSGQVKLKFYATCFQGDDKGCATGFIQR